MEEEQENILKQLDTLSDTLSLFKMQLSGFQRQITAIKKNVKKMEKIDKKKKNASSQQNQQYAKKRAPSGFAKPAKVTKELCEFMNRPEGSEIARTEVTKALACYVKENKLLDTQDTTKTKYKRIIPDNKLKSLLGLDTADNSDLNYFSMQKYINKHFTPLKQEQDIINASI